MSNEFVNNSTSVLQKMTCMEFLPNLVDDDYPVATYTKIPLSRVLALGTAFEPLVSAVHRQYRDG